MTLILNPLPKEWSGADHEYENLDLESQFSNLVNRSQEGFSKSKIWILIF